MNVATLLNLAQQGQQGIGTKVTGITGVVKFANRAEAKSGVSQRTGKPYSFVTQRILLADPGPNTEGMYVNLSFDQGQPGVISNQQITVDGMLESYISKKDGQQHFCINNGRLTQQPQGQPPQQQAQASYAPQPVQQQAQASYAPQPVQQQAQQAVQQIDAYFGGKGQLAQPDRYQYPMLPSESDKICRQNALKSAAIFFSGHPADIKPSWEELQRKAAQAAHWTITGDMPAAQAQTEPQPEDDMPPF